MFKNSKQNKLNEIVNNYLWFGYSFPQKFPEWLDSGVSANAEGKEYNIKEVSDRIDKLFDKLLLNNNSKHHVVPISGGWDSRFILAALLDRLKTDQITTFSFGRKGQLDYDIGKKVAQTAGVNHCQIDLKSFDFNWQNIISSVQRAPWTYVPDEMFNFLSMSSVANENDLVWSGFMGDPLTGSHLNPNLTEAQKDFVVKEKRVRNFKLTTDIFNPEAQLPNLPQKNKLFLDDALDLGIRQANCIAPIVLPIKRWQEWEANVGFTSFGARVVAPFIDVDWAGYWLTAPRKLRKNQTLFLKTLRTKYPKLFNIPGTSEFGISDKNFFQRKINKKIFAFKKKVQKKYPWIGLRAIKKLNYLDFDAAFREDIRYEEVIVYALSMLKEKKLINWLDLDKIWIDHYSERKEYGSVLLVLLGLAANLETHYNK